MTRRRVLVVSGPWPERVGCYGTVVEYETTAAFPYKVYPWAGLGDGEVVVLLDHDPLDSLPGGSPEPRTWSCVYDRVHLADVP